jgi:transportin-1
MHAHIDEYIKCLFDRAADTSADVRKLVCAALGLILGTRPDKLVPHIDNVVQYIAYCTKDKDEKVALEACEFWLTFAEDQALKDQLRPYIGTVAPLLLDGMVYSELDLAELDMEDEEDEAVPDKESDIKPKNYGGKKHTHESNDPSQSSSTGAGRARDAADKAFEEEEEEYDDDDDYDDDDEGPGIWNIRKCSAAALDVMAVSFTTELLDALLPSLKGKLFDADWTKRESGILALGAIAEGASSSPVL